MPAVASDAVPRAAAVRGRPRRAATPDRREEARPPRRVRGSRGRVHDAARLPCAVRPRAGAADGCRERRLTHRLPFPDRRPTEGGETHPASSVHTSCPTSSPVASSFLPRSSRSSRWPRSRRAPAASAKAKTCGEKVVDDWYGDGRVDKIFPTHCYLDAIRSLPVDVQGLLERRRRTSGGRSPTRGSASRTRPDGRPAPTDTGRPSSRRRRRAARTGPDRPDRHHGRPGERHARGARRRHLGAVVRADPAADPRRARAAAPRRRRRRLPEPPRAGAPERRAARPRLSSADGPAAGAAGRCFAIRRDAGMRHGWPSAPSRSWSCLAICLAR